MALTCSAPSLRSSWKDVQELKVLTSGPLSSSAPDCLSSSLKEYGASHGANVLGSQLAILVEGRAGTKGFNVRASLFVGPRLSVVFPQGVRGVPWRRRARLPVGYPCGSTRRSFYTRRTLPRAFLLDRMLDQWLHGRKSRERFLRPFHSAFKAASHLQDDASVNFTRGVHARA